MDKINMLEIVGYLFFEIAIPLGGTSPAGN
jgi:hypothetical protein